MIYPESTAESEKESAFPTTHKQKHKNYVKNKFAVEEIFICVYVYIF